MARPRASAPALTNRVTGVVRHAALAATGAATRWRESGWAGLRRSLPVSIPRGDGVLSRLDEAIAADRYADAVEQLALVGPGDPARASAELAVSRLGGDLQAVVSAAPARDARGRRAQGLARRQLAELASPLPTWAGRASEDRAREDVVGRVVHGERPRIVHVVNNSLPRTQAGSTIRTHAIAHAQQAAGWDARVITRPGYPVLQGSLGSSDEEWFEGVRYRHLLPARVPTGAGLFDAYRELLGTVIDAWQPHLLHAASDHVNARAALEVARRRGLPVAYEARSFHEDTWLSRHEHPGAQMSDTYRLMRDRHTEVMLAADVVTTLSAAMRDDIVKRGVDPERVIIAPNAVNESFLMPVRTPVQARERTRLADAFWLGTVTTVHDFEGLDVAVDAAALLRTRGLDARVLVVGDGPALASLRDRAAAAGVPFASPGRVPFGEVMDWYDSLDVFVLPRRPTRVARMVTALKPLEAQARGVPVVGSDLPAVAEVLAPGAALVPALEASSWADALGSLADPEVRAQAGEVARTWVASCRTWPSVVEAYRSAYSSLGVPVG